MTEPAFRILTVCTGNICRSPVAERLLQHGLGATVEVRSAGVGAMIGDPIHPGMADHLIGDGIDADGFSAAQVTARDVRDADLVLALTRAHRADLVQLAPAALRRTFTLLQFARIVASPQLPPVPAGPVDARLRALVDVAARHRAIGAGAPEGDDVPDPGMVYGQDPR